MLRSLASGVSGLADSLSPLYRTPEEQLAAAWSKVTAALQHASSPLSASGHSLHGAGSVAPPAAPSSPPEVSDARWCTSALLRSLAHMVDALRRDTQHSARRAAHTLNAATKHQQQHSPLVATSHALSPPAASQASSASAPASPLSSSVVSPSPAAPSSPDSAASSSVADGACVSYLLRESVLEQLCAFGVSDRPAGMRSVVLRSVDALLSCPHSTSLLSHSSVSAAVAALLAASAERGEQRTKGSRRSVLALCRTVCSHISHSAAVAEVWLSAAPSIHVLSSAPSGCHLLCGVLTSMVNFWSDEGDICSAALFDLACSHSPAVHTVLLQAEYVGSLVGGVVELLAQLPPVSVSPPMSSLLSDHAAGRALSVRLQAIDALCLCGPASVVLSLCSDFRLRVLEGVLAPLLCDVREDVASWATLLLCHIIKRTDSQSLARTIAACLLAVSEHCIEQWQHRQLVCMRATLAARCLTALDLCLSACQSPIESAAGGAGVADVSVAVAASLSPSDSSLLIRRTLIRRIDSMSDSLCLATLQLFIAVVRTKDPAIVDLLLPPPPSTQPFSAAVSDDKRDSAAAVSLFSPSLDSLALLFDGLGDPRSHADFAGTLIDAQREQYAHSTMDTTAPTSLSTPRPPTAGPPVLLSAASLPSADRSMFAAVTLNKLDSLLDSPHHATNVLLSTLLAALACDRRAHVQSWMMGRQSAAAASDEERSVLSSVVRLWRNGRRREHRIPNLTQRLAACKSSLSQHWSAASGELSAGAGGPAAADNVDVQRCLRSWLMLEAVVIELCAIQYCQQARAAQLTQLTPID